MNEARAIEKYADRPNVGCGFLDGFPVTDVQPPGPNPAATLDKRCQRRVIYICGPNVSALVCKCDCRGTPDSLSCRSDQCGFSRKPSAHVPPFFRVAVVIWLGQRRRNSDMVRLTQTNEEPPETSDSAKIMKRPEGAVAAMQDIQLEFLITDRNIRTVELRNGRAPE